MPIPVGKTSAEKAEIKTWLKGRSKFMTGFCNDINKPGQHEGQKPRSGGKPLPTCPMISTCPCECHMRVDKMFELGKMERREVPNPEYVPEVTEWVQPEYESPVSSTVASNPGGVMTPDGVQQTVDTAPVTALAPLAERRTDTGRAARGGLEAQVWEACIVLAAIDPLTPKVVGEWIANKYVIPTPSSGAINAVWDRWEKMEFARQGKKPNRFLGFTGDNSWPTLQRLKHTVKHEKAKAASNLRRGIR